MSIRAWILRNLRDPVSGLTHLAGAFLGAVGLWYLLQRTLPGGNHLRIAAALIFGISLILLYLSSAAYHLLHVSESKRLMLRRIDHALIFTLIAGTYTPYCLVTLDTANGFEILMVVWGIAIVGFGMSIFWIHAPRWLSTALYLFMGWFVVVDIKPLFQTLSPPGSFWLVAGGLTYTLGALVYAFKRPDPFPPHFGFHEIWHLMVLAGSACHFISILYVL